MPRHVLTAEDRRTAARNRWAGHVNEATRICTKCWVEKDRRNDFPIDKRRRDSVATWCYACFKEYRDAHPVDRRDYYRRRYQRLRAVALGHDSHDNAHLGHGQVDLLRPGYGQC